MKGDSNIENKTVGDSQTGENLSNDFERPRPFQFKQKSKRSKALFALGLVCFFWGTTWIASRQGVQHMPALQLAGLRQFLGGIGYVIFFLIKGAKWPTRKEWGIVVILSVLNFVLSNGLSTWGVKYISAGLGAIIGAIFPLWLVVIGLFSRGKALGKKTILGLLLGFAGICVIFYEHLDDFLKADFRFGIFISLVATWSWAFGTLYTKKHATGFNPYFSLGLQMLISGALLMSISEATGQAIPYTKIPFQSWMAVLYLLVFSSFLCFVAFLYALQNLPTEQTSLYAYVNPIVAVLLGWLLFDELLTPFVVVGTLVTLYGVYLVNRSLNKII